MTQHSEGSQAGSSLPVPLAGEGASLAGAGAHEFDGIDEVVELAQRSAGRGDTSAVAMFTRLRGPSHLLRAGDAAALRDHLVLLHAPLVEHCARNYTASGEPLEDLLQEGYVGLIKAVDRFDPAKGVRFSTYACHLITGEIRHYLRDLGKIIHEPGWHSELRNRIARTGDDLSQKLSRPVAPEEIAESLGLRAALVRDVLRNMQVLAVDSLDSERGDGDDGDEPRRPEILSPGRLTEPQVEERVILEGALPQLKELEKRAIQGFFFEEKSKTQVAADLGISVNYAAYLIKQGTQHLREIIEGSAASAPPTPPQARASYLLDLMRRTVWPGPPPPAARSRSPRRKGAATSGLAEFAAFVSELDDELRRSHRFGQEACLVWLWASGWQGTRTPWSPSEQAGAVESILALVRGDVRDVDRVFLLPLDLLPGLHFVLVLPHVGETGRVVEDRLQRDLPLCPGLPQASTLAWKTALAVLPRDGHSTDALFATLGVRLSAQA